MEWKNERYVIFHRSRIIFVRCSLHFMLVNGLVLTFWDVLMETWILILAIVSAPNQSIYDMAYELKSQEACYKKADYIRQIRGDVIQTFCIKKGS